MYLSSLKGLEIQTMGYNIDYGICFCPNQTSFYLNEIFFRFMLPVGLTETQLVLATIHNTLNEGRLRYTRQILCLQKN